MGFPPLHFLARNLHVPAVIPARQPGSLGKEPGPCDGCHNRELTSKLVGAKAVMKAATVYHTAHSLSTLWGVRCCIHSGGKDLGSLAETVYGAGRHSRSETRRWRVVILRAAKDLGVATGDSSLRCAPFTMASAPVGLCPPQLTLNRALL